MFSPQKQNHNWMMDVLIYPIVMILQHIYVSNHHILYLKYIQFVFVNVPQ